MFFQEDGNVNSGLDSALSKVNLLKDGLKGVYNLIRDEISPKKIMQDADEINRSAAKMARETLGRGREISNMLTTTFANARLNTLEFGVGLQENLELFGAINNQLQTTRLLTSQQLTDMNALAMSVGLTSEEMAGFIKNFDMLGKGTDDAIGAIARLQTEARSYGLNVGQFMRTVGENIKLVASYNFKGGVDGLSKMVAQAQSLRIDMGSTVKFAEELMDPTKAIETAAGFQMIGGAVGKLADPFQLLHMAQTDMAGLQDELVNMSAAAVTFNESTGEFDIPVTEMYRMREAAKLAGMGYQEFAEMAMNSAKKTKKLEFLEGLANIPEEQKEMVANLGELQGGQLKISIGDDLVDVANLTESQLEELGKFQQDLNKTDEQLRAEAIGIARDSLGVMRQIEAKLAQTAARPETDIILSGDFQRAANELTTRTSRSVDALDEKIRQTNFADLITTIYDKMIPDLTQDQIDKYVGKTFEVAQALVDAVKKFDFSDLSVDEIRVTADGVTILSGDVERDLKNVSNNGGVERNLTGNAQPAGDLVVTSQGESFQTAVDDYIFAISEQNLSNLSNTIGKLSTQTTQPVMGDFNVNGTVKVDIAGTNTTLTEQQLNDMVRNNPTLIANIIKQITGSENNYGGTNSNFA